MIKMGENTAEELSTGGQTLQDNMRTTIADDFVATVEKAMDEYIAGINGKLDNIMRKTTVERVKAFSGDIRREVFFLQQRINAEGKKYTDALKNAEMEIINQIPIALSSIYETGAEILKSNNEGGSE